MFKSNFSTHIVCKILIRLPAKHQRTQEVLEYAVYRLSYPAACTQHVQYRHNISDAIAISNRQSFRTYFAHQPLDSLITQEEFSRAVSQQNLSQQIGQWVNDGKKNVLNLLTLYHQGIDHATFYEALEAFVYHHIKKQPTYKRQEWRNREINRTNYPDTYLAASEFINKRHIISELVFQTVEPDFDWETRELVADNLPEHVAQTPHILILMALFVNNCIDIILDTTFADCYSVMVDPLLKENPEKWFRETVVMTRFGRDERHMMILTQPDEQSINFTQIVDSTPVESSIPKDIIVEIYKVVGNYRRQ